VSVKTLQESSVVTISRTECAQTVRSGYVFCTVCPVLVSSAVLLSSDLFRDVPLMVRIT
jgi:hypothetical protein